ncbi:MAG: hypothetical protein NC093_10840 [Alistipes sp.]|nr:hypothetical protein [Alistipes sp.]
MQKQQKINKNFKKRELRNQRKIKRNASAGLLILKPVSYSAGRMKASAWQKAVNEDQDNDFVHVIDSAKRRIAEPAVHKVSKPERLQREQKKRDRLKNSEAKSNKRLNRQENKLKAKHDSFKKKQKRKPKNKAKKSLSEGLKKLLKFVKNVYAKEAVKFFATLAVPVIIILLVFAFIIMIFSSISHSSSFTLGTYAAQDYDLSEAEKYYTELAYNFNQKILKVSNSDTWKDGLTDFGANKNDLKDTPNNWYWGKSSVYDWEPQYDFDCYKLWAFLCAYYYDFDAENGDIKYWKFTSDTENLLDEIFNAEYEFEHYYDNTSGWEYRQNFDFRGYYSIDGSGISGNHGYINISYPDALPFQGYNNGKTIYFDLSNGEVLNYSDNYSATGWYLKNQYADDHDNSGTKYGAWYVNGEQCSCGIWENDVLVTPIPYVITEHDWCSFLKKYDWKTDCRLYYNVRQKKTFDEVIAEKLSNLSHSDERIQYYNLLVGTDGSTMYGNHQTLKNLLPESSIRSYSLKREFGYEMTGWNIAGDGLYQGIKVYADSGTKLKMPFSGKITDVNTTDNKITIRKDDVEYWYDGNGGTKRDTEVTIANAVLLSGFFDGDTVSEDTEFAQTTAGNVNFHIYIDTDGYGWDYIDPRLVLY